MVRRKTNLGVRDRKVQRNRSRVKYYGYAFHGLVGRPILYNTCCAFSCSLLSQRLSKQEQNRLRKTELANSETRNKQNTNDYTCLAFRYSPAEDYSFNECVVIGAMTDVCSHCKALKFHGETPGMCCAAGKVRLPPLPEPPEPLRALLVGDSAESNHFLRNIRKYNSCFQMTSFGGEIVTHQFMPTFKVRGQVYHRAGSLLPLSDAQHKFLQLYFIANTKDELDSRCAISSEVRRSIVAQLQDLLHERNNLVRLFKAAIDKMTKRLLSFTLIKCPRESTRVGSMRQRWTK